MINLNKKYTFIKSGSIVRPIERQKNKFCGLILWEVECIDNNKRMIVTERSLCILD